MSYVEFLVYIVRVSYETNKGTDKEGLQIQFKISETLTKLLKTKELELAVAFKPETLLRKTRTDENK